MTWEPQPDENHRDEVSENSVIGDRYENVFDAIQERGGDADAVLQEYDQHECERHGQQPQPGSGRLLIAEERHLQLLRMLQVFGAGHIQIAEHGINLFLLHINHLRAVLSLCRVHAREGT